MFKRKYVFDLKRIQDMVVSYILQGDSPVNLLLEYWTGTVAAGTETTSRHASMNILFCVGTPDSQDNGFELSYAIAPRKWP